MALHLLLEIECFLVLLCLQLASTTEIPITKPGCKDKCGNVSIPYPFGIGEGCAIDSYYFQLTCNGTLPDNTRPVYGSFNISDISILNGEMTAALRIVTKCSDDEDNYWAQFGKFTFSSTKNKFIAIGCDTMAYIRGKGYQNSSVGTGCMSYCNKIGDTTNGTCNGVGCCEASIPSGLRRYETILGTMYSLRKNLSFNPCSYAFLAEKSTFNFSSSYLKNFKNNGTLRVPVVVDWTIGNETCEEAQRNLTSYACGPNTDCIPASRDVEGYRCSCKTGYQGNPYLNMSTGGHCQDIDECKTSLHNCSKGPGSFCTNTEGSYNCSCLEGYRLEVKHNITDCLLEPQRNLTGSQSNRNNNLNKIVLGACLGLLLILVSLVTGFWIYWGHRKRKHMEVKAEFFRKNGGLILNRLLDEQEEDTEASTRNGKHRSVATIYTEKELSKATNNYHESQILGRGGFGTVYKGTLSNGKVVAIKKTKIVDMNQNEQFINEIAVLSQINHKNVVQLLGCCLESEVPLLVYEYISNGTLHQHVHEHRENQTGYATLSWENRLRIASEIAGSLAYLHSEASIPIIHRDVKSGNVLLDDDYKAKVADFGGSRLNPTDEAQLSTVVQGTFGYLDPEYMQSSQLTDKSDVYSFGVLLVELLTGKAVFDPQRQEEHRNLASYFLSSMKTNRLFAILDDSLVRYDNELVSSVDGHQQIQEMAELAQKCLRVKGEKRPSMKEVAMVLHGLLRVSCNHPWVLDDDEDITNTTSKEKHMLLLESSELLSYTDSITTIGDSSKGISALQTEGR